MRKTVLSIVTLLAMLFVGCATFSDAVTPCQIDKEALAYAEEPATHYLPFSTVLDAHRVDRRVDFTHMENQLKLARQIEDDTLKYDYMKGVSRNHIQQAKQAQEIIFNPENLTGLATSLGFGGIIGALAFKRPGDVSRDDHKSKVNEAGKADPKKFQAVT